MSFTERVTDEGTLVARVVCCHSDHDWHTSQLYSDGYTKRCERCGRTVVYDR